MQNPDQVNRAGPSPYTTPYRSAATLLLPFQPCLLLRDVKLNNQACRRTFLNETVDKTAQVGMRPHLDLCQIIAGILPLADKLVDFSRLHARCDKCENRETCSQRLEELQFLLNTLNSSPTTTRPFLGEAMILTFFPVTPFIFLI